MAGGFELLGRRTHGYDPWWALTVAIIKPLLHMAYRWRFAGRERIPREGPVILASNHLSVVDAFAVGLAATYARRPVRYLMVAELFDRPFLGFLLRRIRQIPIRRGAHDRLALEEALRTLRAGEVVGIFPEGRVQDGPGPGPGHSGVARLALASGVPILPVAVWGTQHRWPRSGLRFGRPFRPHAAVVVGEPVAPGRSPGSSEAVHDLTRRVMAEIERLEARARTAGRGGGLRSVQRSAARCTVVCRTGTAPGGALDTSVGREKEGRPWTTR